jgi:hypothetical protein
VIGSCGEPLTWLVPIERLLGRRYPMLSWWPIHFTSLSLPALALTRRGEGYNANILGHRGRARDPLHIR